MVQPPMGQPSTEPVLWLCLPPMPRADRPIDGQVVGSDTWGQHAEQHEVREGSLCGCRCCRGKPEFFAENIRALRGSRANSVFWVLLSGWGYRQGLSLRNPRTLPRMARRRFFYLLLEEGADLLGGRL